MKARQNNGSAIYIMTFSRSISFNRSITSFNCTNMQTRYQRTYNTVLYLTICNSETLQDILCTKAIIGGHFEFFGGKNILLSFLAFVYLADI